MKKLYIWAILLLAVACGSCSDDPDYIPSEPGKIENENGVRFSVIHLSADGLDRWQQSDDAEFRLVDPVNQRIFTFAGDVLHAPDVYVLGKYGAATCRIGIGEENIPDGEYFLTVSGEGLPVFGMRRVRFNGNIGEEIDAAPMDYEDLEGEGTAENPYLIGSPDDFLALLYYLQDDPGHAYGRYFKQTASFDLPRRSMMIDGRIWLPATFSGNYNGGGYELKSLVYQGASDPANDSGIGLFKDLYSCVIENVNITDAMVLNTCSDVGLIAGSASGDCVFKNITVSGTIMAQGDNVGGIVGRATGNITFSNITIKSLAIGGSETASTCVGGVLGSFADGTLEVSGVSTPDHIFSVTGFSRVGGIAGSVDVAESAAFKGVTLEHSVDGESSTVKAIYAADTYTGGIAGYCATTGDLRFEKVNLKCPVRCKQDVGSIAGHAVVGGDVSFASTVLSSVVNGDVTVGGFFGYLNLGSSNSKLHFLGSDNSNRYIVKSSAKADVEGGSYVGGMVGYLEGNHGSMAFDGKVEIAVNVSGVEEIGGAVGHMVNISSFNPNGINFSSTTMRVTASGNYAGGVVGHATGSTISGGIDLNLGAGIPSADSFKSVYSGVVKAQDYAGGIAGYYSGTLRGVACAASVTSDVNAGGVSGYFEGTVSDCVFLGSVAGKSYVAGIYSRSTGSVNVKECLNMADINTGTSQAGIAAYTCAPENGSLKIDGCYNTGNLTGAREAGGIAAYLSQKRPAGQDAAGDHTIELKYCGNSGNIAANGDGNHSVAGVVAFVDFHYSHIMGNANHGKISSSAVQFVIGGVVGELGKSEGVNWNRVSRCMNSGEVSCSAKSTKLGGVVGHLHSGNLGYTGEIKDCYNTGNMPSDQKDDTGGILGYAAYHTNTFRTFNRGQISHGNAIIGTHKSGSLFNHSHNYYLEGTGGSWPSSTSVKKDRITDKSVYKDFDFENVWDMGPDGPVLRSCPFQFFD